MQYNETQLTKLIEDVEKEFTAHLAKAEEGLESPLAKAEDGEKKPFPPKKEGQKPEAKEAEHAEGEKPAHEASQESHEAPAGKPEGHEAAPAEGNPAEGQPASGHDYDEEDMAHMRQMYMSMSEPELKAHHDCIAELAKCGSGMEMGKSEIEDENPELNSKPHDKGEPLFADKKDGGIEPQEPHNALGAKSPASNANGAKINKSEHDRRNGGKIEAQAPGKIPGAKAPASKSNEAAMEKSEGSPEVELLKSELGSVNAKYDDLKKNFDAVAAFLTKLVEKKAAPAAKAITSLDVIAKSENTEEEKPLTKSEIDSVLLKKAQSASTSKTDRDAINAYYLSGESLRSISHLLK
jgi:hypothetical protein